MFQRNQHGERRVSPSTYKLLLTTHIAVSGAWLGVVVAKLALGIAAITAGPASPPATLYAAIRVVDPTFPPLAIATIISGVLLSLGTRWGLLTHTWVVTKIGLTVGVIATAVPLSDRFVRQAIAAPAPEIGLAQAVIPLLVLSAAHALMLGTATILSVYKPWGKTWLVRPVQAPFSRGSSASRSPSASR